MSSALSKSLRLLLLLTPCLTALAIAGGGSPQTPAQGSKQSTSNAPIYFPLEQRSTPVFSVILPYLGEPSLLEAAKDANR
jgi:hypothetical protein